MKPEEETPQVRCESNLRFRSLPDGQLADDASQVSLAQTAKFSIVGSVNRKAEQEEPLTRLRLHISTVEKENANIV